MNLLELEPVFYNLAGLLLATVLPFWFVKWLFKRSWLPEWFDSELRKKLTLPLTFSLFFGIVALLLDLKVFGLKGWVIPEQISHFLQVTVLAILVWTVSVILKVLTRFLRHKNAADRQWQTNISGLEKFGMLVLALIGIILILQTLGYDVSNLVAIGGIAGIAVGLASRDMLANIFGGMFLYLDKPFSVGDWIRSPDRKIEGTVKQIGIRQTKLVTFDLRPLYIPNALFGNVIIENPTRMANRRIYEKFGLRYKDAHVLQPIVSEIKQWLDKHPEIDSSKTLMVNFDRFADSALECFIYAFTHTSNWEKYHSIKQEVMLKVLSIIEAYDASCAFPTQTLDIKDSTKSTTQKYDEDNDSAAVIRTITKQSNKSKID